MNKRRNLYREAMCLGFLGVLISILLFYFGLNFSGILNKIIICLSGAICGAGLFLILYLLTDAYYVRGEQP